MSRIGLALLLLVAAGAAVYVALPGAEEDATQPARVGNLNVRTSGTRVSVAASVVAAASPLVSVRFEWGDGNADDLTLEDRASSWTVRAEHDYAASGEYQVVLVASFADGSEVEAARAVDTSGGGASVAGAPPSVPADEATATASASPTPEPAVTEEPAATATEEPTPPPAATVPPTETPSPEPTEPVPTASPTPSGPQPPDASIVQLSAGGDLSATVVAVFVDPEGALIGAGIDWGDGSVDEVGGGSVTRTHTYAAPGTYSVTAFAIDAQGLEAATSQTVTVLPGS